MNAHRTLRLGTYTTTLLSHYCSSSIRLCCCCCCCRFTKLYYYYTTLLLVCSVVVVEFVGRGGEENRIRNEFRERHAEQHSPRYYFCSEEEDDYAHVYVPILLRMARECVCDKGLE